MTLTRSTPDQGLFSLTHRDSARRDRRCVKRDRRRPATRNPFPRKNR